MELETIILFALLCKHAVADLAVQSFRVPSQKHLYFNKGLHLHSLDHSVLAFITLLIFVDPITALMFSLLDYVCHWHIDYTKSNILKKFNISREGPAFWRLQTFDQIFHYATYALIVFLM